MITNNWLFFIYINEHNISRWISYEKNINYNNDVNVPI